MILTFKPDNQQTVNAVSRYLDERYIGDATFLSSGDNYDLMGYSHYHRIYDVNYSLLVNTTMKVYQWLTLNECVNYLKSKGKTVDHYCATLTELVGFVELSEMAMAAKKLNYR